MNWNFRFWDCISFDVIQIGFRITSTQQTPTVNDKYENHSACTIKIICIYLEKLIEENIQLAETSILNSKNVNA